MRKTLYFQIPKYKPDEVTLANGVNVKAALQATGWGKTEIQLSDGRIATILPDIDEDHKPGATNYYTVNIDGKTRHMNYLRQVVRYLNGFISNENDEKTLRKTLLERFKAANWSPIAWHKNDKTLTIAPVVREGEKRIHGYCVSDKNTTCTVNTLTELVAMLA